MVKLSKRLERIAAKVPPGSKLADIGSDHALLPVRLVQQERIAFAVAGEVNPGPWEAAKKQVERAGLEDRIDVRLGDGLEVIRPGEVNVITIAGMGGALIVRILSMGIGKLAGVDRLILQPNVGEDHVRRWLHDRQWHLASEEILEEDEKIYEILEFVRGPAEADRDLYEEQRLPCGLRVSTDRLFRMGPYLLRNPVAAWFKKWEGELGKMEAIHENLTKSASAEAKAKREELRRHIEETKEVLACLRKDKP